MRGVVATVGFCRSESVQDGVPAVLSSAVGHVCSRRRRAVGLGSLEERLKLLEGSCYSYLARAGEWWSYKWCHRQAVTQFHENEDKTRIEWVDAWICMIVGLGVAQVFGR